MTQPLNRSTTALFFFALASIPFLLRRPRLLLLAIVPIVINALLFVTLMVVLNWFVTLPLVGTRGEEEPWMETYAAFITATISIFFTLVISLFVTFVLIIPVSAPFCDMISERIERELLAERPELIVTTPFKRAVLHAITEAVKRLAAFVPILLLILLLGFFPVIGPPTAALLGLFSNAVFLSLDAFSYPMDRRLMTFGQKREFLRGNRRLWLPLGLGMAAMLIVPCNVLFLPLLSSVAATRLYCERLLRENVAAAGEEPR